MRLLLKSLGPGVITGAADDDPSGIATYSVAGAQLGTKLLWTALLTWPLMAAVQMMCARIGKVTGQGLAGNFKQISELVATRLHLGLACGQHD
jgi:Mn2+/Fe2+ NRAMP family transporter